MHTKAYIAGSGIITSIGHNVAENLAALKAGKAAITVPELLLTHHRLPVGEIKRSNEALAVQTGVSAALPDRKSVV